MEANQEGERDASGPDAGLEGQRLDEEQRCPDKRGEEVAAADRKLSRFLDKRGNKESGRKRRSGTSGCQLACAHRLATVPSASEVKLRWVDRVVQPL